MSLQVVGVTEFPRVQPGDNLPAQVVQAITAVSWPDGTHGVRDGDIVVITSKVVSKCEGRIVTATSRDDVIDRETVRDVASKRTPRGLTRIVQTRHGLVLAAAGVDASNVESGTVVLLPEDPDASARHLAHAIRAVTSARIAVVITDTMGRPWRMGVTDVAIGSAGLSVLDDYTGRIDSYGRTLEMTVVAVADEVAAATDLVKGKTADCPVAVVRGLDSYVTDDLSIGCGPLIRPLDEDLFWLGTAEAIELGRRTAPEHRRTVRHFTDASVSESAVAQAIAAAVTAPAPHHSKPWRFLVLRDEPTRLRLLDAMRTRWIADLVASGFDTAQIDARVSRGDILRTAPVIVVPFIDLAEGAHDYPDAHRSSAERDMFLVSGGAAVQNFMISIAAQGLGSAWIGSTMFCADVVRRTCAFAETLHPLGAVAIGHPAEDLPPRPRQDAHIYVLP